MFERDFLLLQDRFLEHGHFAVDHFLAFVLWQFAQDPRREHIAARWRLIAKDAVVQKIIRRFIMNPQ